MNYDEGAIGLRRKISDTAPRSNPAGAPFSRRTTTSVRGRISQARAGLLSLFGFDRGFFVRYEYAASVKPVSSPYPEVEDVFSASGFEELLTEMSKHISIFRSLKPNSPDPDWQSRMFPQLDGAAAYAAVKKFKPKLILEIGSGDSSRYLAKAAADVGTEITCIDPQPRRSIEHLPVRLLRRLMDSDDADLCAALEADDILFIDSSHIMLPGMDVDIQFNRCFPKLKPGVLVHLHDIFLPDDYPAHWRERRYSEQNALIGWILSGYFNVIYPGHYVLTRKFNFIERAFAEFPITQTRSAGSLWLRKR